VPRRQSWCGDARRFWERLSVLENGVTRIPESKADCVVEVVIGVILTAVLGGLLVPLVKDHMDRRRQSVESSLELLDVLATSLWTYWALAHRVAYYGQQGERSAERYNAALQDWDSADAWKVGRDIRIQVSRAKRLIRQYQPDLDHAQRRSSKASMRESKRFENQGLQVIGSSSSSLSWAKGARRLRSC
jgi:hypothetical protein